jgi:Zn-finger nucleic acid-binding protein
MGTSARSVSITLRPTADNPFGDRDDDDDDWDRRRYGQGSQKRRKKSFFDELFD